MISIEDRLKSSEQARQKFFSSGLMTNTKKVSKKTKNRNRTIYRRSKKTAKDYMSNAKSIVEFSPSYVKIYDKEKPHKLKTMMPTIDENGKVIKTKNFTLMPSVAGASLDHPLQFISE